MENGSVTKSQKNFSSPTSTSNTNCLSSTPLGSPVLSTRREVTEEEAERSDVCFNTVHLLLLNTVSV